MARPRKTVNAKRVITLASKGMTVEEIAAFEDVSHDTITRRFACALEKGRHLLTASIKRKQVEKAIDEGDNVMLIWLGKQYCGQADREKEIPSQMTVVLGDVINIQAGGDLDAARQVWLGRGQEAEHQGNAGSGPSTQPVSRSRLLNAAPGEGERELT